MQNMPKKFQGKSLSVKGLLRLTRYPDYTENVIIITFLGILFTQTKLSFESSTRILLILLANWMAVCFTFMINDVEDAKDDMHSKEKSARNPVVAGLISTKNAYLSSFLIAFVSLILFFTLGPLPLLLGALTVTLGILYSWRKIRLKSVPIFDMISHGLMLAGLQLAAAYFSFAKFDGLKPNLFLPFLMFVSISMYGELYNEVRDFHCDKKAGIWHTAALIGIRNAKILMFMLIFSAAVIFIYILASGIFPLWFPLSVLIITLCLISAPKIGSKRYKGKDFYKFLISPIISSGMITSFLWLGVKIFGY
jgi:4-hydroxybenzoate polyprenyltransferase